MKRRTYCLIAALSVLMISCGQQESNEELRQFAKSVSDSLHQQKPAFSELEERLKLLGLADVQELDSTIQVDLRYSTTNNFLGIDVYGDMERAYLQPDVAERLVKAQHMLKQREPGLSLLVLDAVRPMSLQQVFWDSVKVPVAERGKYLANPGNGGSIHNYGAAVDVTLVDAEGHELDMGCPFDFFGDLAQPAREAECLARGELTQQQINNRKLLREVMHQAGLFNLSTEWWHFNACSREKAMELYRLVE